MTAARPSRQPRDQRIRQQHQIMVGAAGAPLWEYVSRVVFGARLAVLGSLNMDISVTVPRLPAPGATVLGGAAAFAPGGKGANQAVAAARLGGSVRMVGCVGDDDFGARLLTALAADGIESGVRTVPGVPTGLAMITVDGAGENIITVAPGANREVGAAEVASVAAVPADVLVISAEIPLAVIKTALTAGPATQARNPTRPPGPPGPPAPPAPPGAPGAPVRVLNLAPAPPDVAQALDLIAVGVDWLVVNESEAAAVLRRPVAGLAGAARAAADLAKAGARNAVVTAGAAGAAYCGQETRGEGPAGVLTVPGFRVTAVDTVGAGDTFVGALAVALAAGVAAPDAVRAASAAAATAATRPGTQSGMPHPADVLAATGYPWPVPAP